jgi:AsmA protein
MTTSSWPSSHPEYLHPIALTKQVLSGINATLKLPDFAGPGAMSIAAVMNGRKVAVSGHVDRFGDFVAGKAGPATFDVVAGGSKIGFTGTAGMGPWVANGALDANLGDLATVFGALGQPVPKLPEGLGSKTIAVKGQFTYGANQVIRLHKAVVTLDSNQVSGDVTVALAGARPKVTANLAAGALNLASLGGGSGGGAAGSGGGAGSSASAGWSKAPIDASAMGAMDADVSLSAASLDLGAVKLGKSAISVALAAGRAVVTLKPVTAYQGAVSGQVTVDGARGLSVASNLNISNMALQPLLSDYAGYKRLIGTANAKVALAGAGGSMDAIMHSLSGSGSISIGKGEIQGLDLAGMLTSMNMNYMGAGAKTIFDGITASYTVKGGVLSNNDLSLKAPLLTASGAGTVNLGARTLDYTVTPTALQGLAGAQGVSVPLKISGPWAAPSFGLDMNSAVGAKINAEKKKLEDKAKAAAAKAIADKLGGGTSGSTGNALQDKAAQGLMKLLGGN